MSSLAQSAWRAGAAGLLALVACKAPPPKSTSDYMPRHVVELRRWTIQQEGQQIGWLVMLEIEDPQGPLRFYRVENPHRQWVGTATLQGRFSRRVPFRDDEEDLGLWSMPQGLAKLFDTDKPLALETVEVPVRPAEAVPASTSKGRQ